MPDKADQKVAPKMVRESDLLAVKAQVRELKETLAAREAKNAQLESEVKMAKANLEDDESTKEVRGFLLERDKELNEREADLEKKVSDFKERESSYQERERETRIKTLVSEYGVELNAIKDADDPEKEALKLVMSVLRRRRKQLLPKKLLRANLQGAK